APSNPAMGRGPVLRHGPGRCGARLGGEHRAPTSSSGLFEPTASEPSEGDRLRACNAIDDPFALAVETERRRYAHANAALVRRTPRVFDRSTVGLPVTPTPHRTPILHVGAPASPRVGNSTPAVGGTTSPVTGSRSTVGVDGGGGALPKSSSSSAFVLPGF